MRQTLLDQPPKWLFGEKIVQLLHILHLNQQPHMISNYIVKIVEQNERIPTP